jgi:hypothetical protein
MRNIKKMQVVPLALAVVLTTSAGTLLAQTPSGGSDLAEIRQRLDAMEKGIQGSFQAARGEIDSLKERLAQLEKELENLRRQQPAVPRISNFPPTGAATGRIYLINQYSQPVQLVLNGTTYRLAPRDRYVLDGQPAGPFTYEVLGIQPPIKRVLDAGGAYTIRVYPQQ